MGVHVDEARDRHEALAVDRAVDGAGVAGADMDDLVALEHQVGAVEIDVALLGFVPGDDVIEVCDASGAHRSLTLCASDWHDRDMTAKLTESAKGVYIIAATPFTDDGALDLQSVDTLTDFYIRCGVHGFTLLGMMGEAHKLTADEVDRGGEARDRPRRRPPGDRRREPCRPRECAAAVPRGDDRGRRGRDGGAAGRAQGRRRTSTTTMRRSSRRSGRDIPVVYQDYPQATGVYLPPAGVRAAGRRLQAARHAEA